MLAAAWGGGSFVSVFEAIERDGRSVARSTLGKELGWNSIYAATEIGAGGSILSSTAGGLVALAPAS